MSTIGLLHTNQICFLFDKEAGGTQVTIEELFNLSSKKKRKLCVLTDQTLDDPQSHLPNLGWFIILAGSPEKRKALYDRQKGQTPNLYFICNWDQPKICAAYW